MEDNLLLLKELIFSLVCFLFSATIHVVWHAFSAWLFGDDTARQQGRLSLNPLVHLDFFGTIIFPLMTGFIGLPVFGWMRPVPVQSRNFTKPGRDYLIVSLAAPLSHFLQAALGLLLLTFGLKLQAGLGALAEHHIFLNLLLLLKLYLRINLILLFINLLPCPPLDGARLLPYFMSLKAKPYFTEFSRYGIILLFLLLFSAIFRLTIIGIVNFSEMITTELTALPILYALLPLLTGLLLTSWLLGRGLGLWLKADRLIREKPATKPATKITSEVNNPIYQNMMLIISFLPILNKQIMAIKLNPEEIRQLRNLDALCQNNHALCSQNHFQIDKPRCQACIVFPECLRRAISKNGT